MKKHLTDLRLEELYLARPEEDREALLHLAGCPRCRERLAGVVHRHAGAGGAAPDTAGRAPEPGALLSGAAVAFAAVLARERLDAPELFLELLRHPAESWDALLRKDARYRTWGLLELLVERSPETATQAPERAEELGRLALLLAGRLDAGFYGAGPLEDLRARAWAHIANARRVRSDLRGAEEAFAAAEQHLGRGTGDPFEAAVHLDLRASLRRDQRLFAEAIALSQQAVEIFREQGDPHRAGRSLVKLSTIHYFLGDLDRAMDLLRQSLDLVDPEEEPRLLLCARHNLIDYLTLAGRFLEARDIYRRTRPLYRDFAEPWVQNRRKWVRARILRGLGHPDLAESLLLEVRDGFLAEGIPYDTALASLELATLYAGQGRPQELKRLAGEMLPIFSSLHIHREALAALAYLHQAIEAERAGVEVVTAVADYLKRARHLPDLRFEAPGIRARE